MGSSYDERGLKIKELCFKISEYKSSIAQLQNELKSEENVTLYWQGYSQSYKKNSEYWEGRCEMYKKEIEVLKKDCGIHETNNEKDKASGDQYEKLYEEQIKVTGGLKLEITALGSAIKELQSKKTALESQIEALELHKTVVNNEVSALKDVNNALKDANAAQKNTIAAMTDNINDMKLTKTSLEIRLQARGYDMAGMKPFTKERETMLKEVTAKNGIQTMSVNELMVERAALKDALKARDTIQQTPVKTKDAEVVKEVASPMTGSGMPLPFIFHFNRL
jgi:chromosome segregation ATPase